MTIEQEIKLILEKYMVHKHHREIFLSYASGEMAGGICSCGHPVYAHRGNCRLNKTCGCQKFSQVAETLDLRPFFQVTHGPMEAHALGRGITLAKSLGIEVWTDFHCFNWCKQYSKIGAFRTNSSRREKPILTKNRLREVHLIVCDNCLEDRCLDLDPRS